MSYLCTMTRTPTRRLADVARKVGVSEATVSRVLNGKAGVSDTTRKAVLTALDVLGYERPTQLRGERARLIGLVLPELQDERGVPVVLINAAIEDLEFPCVSTDDMTAAGQAFAHLASLGHQRIGL